METERDHGTFPKKGLCVPSVDWSREGTQWEGGGWGARGCTANNVGWWWVTAF